MIVELYSNPQKRGCDALKWWYSRWGLICWWTEMMSQHVDAEVWGHSAPPPPPNQLKSSAFCNWFAFWCIIIRQQLLWRCSGLVWAAGHCRGQLWLGGGLWAFILTHMLFLLPVTSGFISPLLCCRSEAACCCKQSTNTRRNARL